MLNCSFVGVIRPTLFYTGIGQTPCSYEHYLVFIFNAHVKGQKFTAHAPCHVTCRQGVQNNCIFGISEATMPIHYGEATMTIKGSL